MNSPHAAAQSTPARSPVFATTLWTVVLAAGDPNHPGAAAALDRLCCTYWYPVYVYVRRKGRSAPEAEDLTQEFFSRLLGRGFPAGVQREGGKFRSYLLRALDHFLFNEWRRDDDLLARRRRRRCALPARADGRRDARVAL